MGTSGTSVASFALENFFACVVRPIYNLTKDAPSNEYTRGSDKPERRPDIGMGVVNLLSRSQSPCSASAQVGQQHIFYPSKKILFKIVFFEHGVQRFAECTASPK